MRNIITPQDYSRIRREYTARLSGVVLILVSGALFLNVALMASSLIILQTQNASLAKQIDALSPSVQGSGADDRQDELAEFADQVGRMAGYEAASALSAYGTFDDLVSVLPADIFLHSFSFDRGKDVRVIVTVRGVATTRSDLVSFVEILEEQATFSNVVLPVSELAKNEDIDFTLTLDAKPPNASTVKK